MNKIFTLNEWSRLYLINEYGIDSSKIINVGFGINAEYYDGDKDFSHIRILIILRKGLEHYKGLDLLLEAFKIVRENDLEATLHVVGTNYREMEGVTYYYNKPRSVTLELLKKCNLYAMPSMCEPNGITYLEALANKSPILGLNRFAFPEFSGYGKYGIIVNNNTPNAVANAIVSGFQNPNKMRQMGIEGQNYVRNRYNWENVVRKIHDEIINS